jgi:hypothetical protein
VEAAARWPSPGNRRSGEEEVDKGNVVGVVVTPVTAPETTSHTS